jgi:hypothetical protein
MTYPKLGCWYHIARDECVLCSSIPREAAHMLAGVASHLNNVSLPGASLGGLAYRPLQCLARTINRFGGATKCSGGRLEVLHRLVLVHLVHRNIMSRRRVATSRMPTSSCLLDNATCMWRMVCP